MKTSLLFYSRINLIVEQISISLRIFNPKGNFEKTWHLVSTKCHLNHLCNIPPTILLIISSKKWVKSYNKSDNGREKPEMWNDSTRGTIYTSPCIKDKAKAFSGHKQARNFYVRQTASLWFCKVAIMHLHCCAHICISQITMVFAHREYWAKPKSVHVHEKFFCCHV